MVWEPQTLSTVRRICVYSLSRCIPLRSLQPVCLNLLLLTSHEKDKYQQKKDNYHQKNGKYQQNKAMPKDMLAKFHITC